MKALERFLLEAFAAGPATSALVRRAPRAQCCVHLWTSAIVRRSRRVVWTCRG